MSTTRSIIRYTDKDGNRLPGGQCRCCGTGPGDGTLIYLASVCDYDGVFYSMLCGYCFDMIIDENNNRPQTERDTMAKIVREMNADDVDGMEADMSSCWLT